MDWFLYNRDLRHERVKGEIYETTGLEETKAILLSILQYFHGFKRNIIH